MQVLDLGHWIQAWLAAKLFGQALASLCLFIGEWRLLMFRAINEQYLLIPVMLLMVVVVVVLVLVCIFPLLICCSGLIYPVCFLDGINLFRLEFSFLCPL